MKSLIFRTAFGSHHPRKCSRVRYPSYEAHSGLGLPVATLSDVRVEREILDNVLLVPWEGQFYIYKTVNRFFYDPSYTTILFEREISYLRLLRGVPIIAQLIAVVTSRTHFKMNIRNDDGPEVVTGKLIECYLNGTLGEATD